MYPQMSEIPDLDRLEPKEQPYKIRVAPCLAILVVPSGKKFWRFRYRFQNRENLLSFGEYPHVSYEQAASLGKEVKALIKAGQNPVEVRREQRGERRPSRKPSFLMRLSEEGALAIETRRASIRLDPQQAQALRSFLNASDGEM